MALRFDVVTIFPDMFPGPLATGVLGRALRRGLVEIVAHDIRDHAEPPHFQVDDEPFGGGAGMVYKPEPLSETIEEVRAAAVSDARHSSGVARPRRLACDPARAAGPRSSSGSG